MSEIYFDKQTECMSRSQLENLQSERLRDLTAYVYERVPFYRNKMDAQRVKPADIKSIRDIVKLPFTEKSDLRDNYPFNMFAVPKKDVVRIHASSGTTGKMTVVGYTQKDLDTWGQSIARSLMCAGVTRESTVQVAFGYGMFTGGLGLHGGAEMIGARVVPASSGNTARQIMLLKDFEVDALCCTPSYAAYLSDYIQQSGYDIKDFNLKSGLFGAEPWSEEMRKNIERKLHIKALDIYGLSEIMGPGVAVECGCQNGMHVWEDFYYPEILDDHFCQLPYGERGELVFTTLNKEAIPLLRYRTKDICSLDDSPCKCGRTHVRMGKIMGRTDDMLIIRGVNVFPSQIETVLLQMGNVAPHYQLIVGRENNTDTLEICVELVNSMFSDEIKNLEGIRDQIESRVHSLLGISARVRLVEPNSIPRSEGKAVRVIDKRKI